MACILTDDPVYDCTDNPARHRDNALGNGVSLALFSVVGVVFLLLRDKLFDSWIWRCRSPADLASSWACGKRDRRSYVRHFRECPFRDPGAVGRERGQRLERGWNAGREFWGSAARDGERKRNRVVIRCSDLIVDSPQSWPYRSSNERPIDPTSGLQQPTRWRSGPRGCIRILES